MNRPRLDRPQPGLARACCILAASLALLPGAAHAAHPAKAAVAQAGPAATKWQADARLTHVSTLRGQGDGRATQWLLTYYSPKAKKSAIVTVRDGGKVEVDADVRNTSTDPLGSDYIDSDQAVAAAGKAGMKFDRNAKNLGLALVVGNQAVSKPQAFWSVTVMGNKGMSSVTLDAKDGALIKRDEVKY